MNVNVNDKIIDDLLMLGVKVTANIETEDKAREIVKQLITMVILDNKIKADSKAFQDVFYYVQDKWTKDENGNACLPIADLEFVIKQITGIDTDFML